MLSLILAIVSSLAVSSSTADTIASLAVVGSTTQTSNIRFILQPLVPNHQWWSRFSTFYYGYIRLISFVQSEHFSLACDFEGESAKR